MALCFRLKLVRISRLPLAAQKACTWCTWAPGRPRRWELLSHEFIVVLRGPWRPAKAWRVSALAHEFSVGPRRGRLQMAPALSRAWHRLHWCLPAWRHSPSHTLRARQRGWHFCAPHARRSAAPGLIVVLVDQGGGPASSSLADCDGKAYSGCPEGRLM